MEIIFKFFDFIVWFWTLSTSSFFSWYLVGLSTASFLIIFEVINKRFIERKTFKLNGQDIFRFIVFSLFGPFFTGYVGIYFILHVLPTVLPNLKKIIDKDILVIPPKNKGK